MRRKYDERNKKNFIIIIILAILIVGVFSLFIYKYKHTLQIEYPIKASSVVLDTNKDKFEILEDAILKVRWNNTYYMIYQGNKIDLGKNVIVYNSITGKINLYGTFYEIDEKGHVEINNDETLIESINNAKFYKIDDREYLLIDKMIVSDNDSIKASNFLLVELDKLGNAKLSNDKLDLKTIKETTLITSKYKFNINKEVLDFSKETVDLKKIIGSTNQYKEEKKKEKNKDDGGTTNNENGGNGNPSVNGNNGAGGNVNTGVSDVINGNNNGKYVDPSELKDKVKKTAVINVIEGLTQVDIDYVIYDPYNEYLSIFAEILKPGKEVLYLSKTDTHLVINDLIPDTEYTVKFVYSIQDEEGKIKNTVFDEVVFKTRKPEYSISLYEIDKYDKKITYVIKPLSGYPLNNAKVELSFGAGCIDMNTLEACKPIIVNSINEKGMGEISLADYSINKNTLMSLRIIEVSVGDYLIDIDSSYSFRYGG